MNQTPEVFHFDNFELINGELYHKGRNKSLTIRRGELRSVGEIAKILGKEGLCDLGFDIPMGKVTTRQAVILNRVEEELPSASDVAKADDIELQEITESTTKSIEDLIAHFEGHETLPMHELLGLDKQLRSIRGLLKVDVAKKVQLEGNIKKKSASLRNSENILESMTLSFEKTL